MKIRDIIRFKEDIFFDGAVQADWFYNSEKADLVASNYVFHGKEYFGQNQSANEDTHIVDTVTFTQYFVNKVCDDKESVNPFTLAIAGYGSGKSHLAVTLAQLLSGTEKSCVQRIISNIGKIDRKAGEEISSSLKQQNLVLTINGMNDFNLNYEILKSAKRSLELYGLDDEILLSISSACETAKKFAERYFHKNMEAFEDAARKHGVSYTGEELYLFILNELGYDDAIYDIVNEVYSDLTGHEIRWDQGISAGKILETLCNEYCASRGLFNKVVIIFDEFGRYLEYASAYSAKAGDSALQQIFEAAQNTDGLIQFLGFIQSDIKTYLSRVDQSSNISRYISRYDQSDKLHLSSNLETIFANIIERPDPILFEKYISNRVLEGSEKLYSNLLNWIPNLQSKGAWSNSETFRKVICEGIYPFHPLTTYLLSSMSDWLQNRSSLVLLNTNIKKYSGYSVEESLPLIFAVDILDNELFLEILNAEEEGRQRSRFATVYDNIIKRYGSRLSENEIRVLKANLISKICRFTSSSREESLNIIKTCTNLSKTDINNALQYLEVEYGVLTYDERANSFEFVEDSLGASDFRAFIRRKRNNTTCNYDLLSDTELLKLFDVHNPIATDYGTKNYITTSEWQFEQKLFLISDFSEKILEKTKNDCITRYTVDKPKGILIWLYMNKQFDHNELIKVQNAIANVLDDTVPIRIFLLDDSSSNLYNYLIDYTVISEITSEEIVKYGAYFEEYRDKINQNLIDCVLDLKDERKLITKEGITEERIPRLQVYLPKVFKELYPKVIPFTFDGFQGKPNIITRARKQLIGIEKLLCSDLENYLSIKTQPMDVQNKFDYLLCANGPMSWKTITPKGTIVMPGNPMVESIYRMVMDEMDTKGELSLGQIINKLRKPPYGINDFAISLFVVVFISIQRDRIKLILNNQKFSVSKWADKIIDDVNIHIDMMTETEIIVVDSLDVRKKFKEIFDRISANTDISKVDTLEKELNEYLLEEDLPKDLEDSLTLARDIKLQAGKRNKKIYMDMMGDLKEAIALYHHNNDLGKVIELAEAYQYPAVNLGNDYILTDNQIGAIKKYQEHFYKTIEANFIEWADKMLRCREVGAIGSFTKRTKKLNVLLDNLGFLEFARKTRDILDRETSNINAIKERQMVSSNIQSFLVKSNSSKDTSVVLLNEWLQKIKELRIILAENTIINKYDRAELIEKLGSRESSINAAIEEVKEQINSIWDMVYDVESNDDLVKINNKINMVLAIELPDEDTEDLLSLQAFIKNYLELDSTYNQYLDNRNEVDRIHESLIERYRDMESDFDITTAISNRYRLLNENLGKKEAKWIEKYINCSYKEEAKLQQWLTETKQLPLYLSNEAIAQYELEKDKVNIELKKHKVNYILSLISELSDEEWHSLIKAVNR